MDTQAKKATKSTSSLFDKMVSFGKSAAGPLALVFALKKVADTALVLTKLASKQVEAQNKVSEVFEDQADKIIAWSETAVDRMNISKTAALDFAGGIGAITTAMGFTSEESADMSIKLSELATDLSSFFDKDAEQAFNALRSAVTGEFEPMKQFGVILNENRLKQEFLATTGEKLTRVLTAQEKATLSMSIIMRDTSKAQGDLARNQDTFAAQSRKLTASLTELGIEIGEELLPFMTSLTSSVSSLVGFFIDLGKTDLGKLADTLEKLGGEAEAILALRQQDKIEIALKNQIEAKKNLLDFELTLNRVQKNNLVNIKNIVGGEKDAANAKVSQLKSVISITKQTLDASRIQRLITDISKKRRQIETDLFKATGKTKINLIEQKRLYEGLSDEAKDFQKVLLTQILTEKTLSSLGKEELTTKKKTTKELEDQKKLQEDIVDDSKSKVEQLSLC